MCWRPAPCNHDRALRYALPLDPRTGENEFTEINDTISTKLHEAGIPWTATSIQDRDLFSSRIIPGADNKSAPLRGDSAALFTRFPFGFRAAELLQCVFGFTHRELDKFHRFGKFKWK